MMFVEPVDLHGFLEELCGTSAYPLLMVRDPASSTGWRRWTSEDTGALCAWISDRAEGRSTNSNGLICYNATEAAKALGVSVPTLRVWLTRRDHPIPHLRVGRKIVIPQPMLMEWLREEASRNAKDRTQ